MSRLFDTVLMVANLGTPQYRTELAICISGKHLCLWYTATTEMIQVTPDERTKSASARTLYLRNIETLKVDYTNFCYGLTSNTSDGSHCYI